MFTLLVRIIRIHYQNVSEEKGLSLVFMLYLSPFSFILFSKATYFLTEKKKGNKNEKESGGIRVCYKRARLQWPRLDIKWPKMFSNYQCFPVQSSYSQVASPRPLP